MKEAVVFNQGRPLDFEDVRAQIARIPEVLLKLREAQSLWDKNTLGEHLSFYSTLMSDDQHYFASSATRSLLSAVVQLGLFDRLAKSHGLSQFLIGNIRNDSAVLVAAGQKTFQDLVIESRAARHPQSAGKPMSMLQGQEFPSFQIFQKQASGFSALGPAHEELESALVWLAERENVRAFVTVGPGSLDPISVESGILNEVCFSESIDKDPLLGWFWSNVKSVNASA